MHVGREVGAAFLDTITQRNPVQFRARGSAFRILFQTTRAPFLPVALCVQGALWSRPRETQPNHIKAWRGSFAECPSPHASLRQVAHVAARSTRLACPRFAIGWPRVGPCGAVAGLAGASESTSSTRYPGDYTRGSARCFATFAAKGMVRASSQLARFGRRSRAEVLPELSSLEGVQSVQRMVCGGCLDFKVVTKLTQKAFGDWEKAGFEPEAAFLEKLKEIPGVSTIETQTYTLEEVKLNKKARVSFELARFFAPCLVSAPASHHVASASCLCDSVPPRLS